MFNKEFPVDSNEHYHTLQSTFKSYWVHVNEKKLKKIETQSKMKINLSIIIFLTMAICLVSSVQGV